LDSLLHRHFPVTDGHPKETQVISALITYFDVKICDYQPIFSSQETPQTAQTMIQEFNIDYILVPPNWRTDFDTMYPQWVSPENKDVQWWDVSGWLIVHAR